MSVFVDVNNATCQQVTTPHSDKSFRLEVELPTAHDHLTLTAVLDGGECLDFPATMVYTKSDQSAMLPYHNNPSFCDNVPGECVFECDCSAMPCQRVFLIILSAPTSCVKYLLHRVCSLAPCSRLNGSVVILGKHQNRCNTIQDKHFETHYVFNFNYIGFFS